MNNFYHVSRTDISQIKQFELIQFDGYIEAETLHSAEEFKKFKSDLYPDGISKHGEIYLHNPYKSTGPNLAFTPNEYLLETTFELVRRLKFPERSSRFTSSFGCLNLEDAREIRDKTFHKNGIIYKVSCNTFFKADMSFLRQAGSIIGLQIVAEKYWAGQPSVNPFWEIVMDNPVKIIERIE